MPKYQRIPLTPADFQWVNWTPAHIRHLGRTLLDYKKQKYTEIKKIPASERTFENTVYAIEAAGRDIFPRVNYIEFLMNVSSDLAVRLSTKQAVDELDKKSVEIEYDEGIYRAFQEYVIRKEKLTGPDKVLFDKMKQAYQRMGFDLSPGKKKQLQANLKKLNKLENQFNKNLNDYEDNILVTREELQGLPENYISSLTKNKTGKYIVSLKYPEFIPFMENAESAIKRQELYDKNLRKGGEGNLKLISQIIKLRHQNARLRGYEHHADFRTEIKMAKNASGALRLVNSVIAKSKKLWVKERTVLTEVKQQLTKNPKAKLEYYDIAYYLNQLKKTKYAVDDEAVREYFPFDVVKRGTFDIYSQLFSVKFEKLSGYPLWHEDVELYVVKNADDSLQGYFALDLFPREGKFNHMAVFTLVKGSKKTLNKNDPAYFAPFSAMVGNFPKPSSNNPGLLAHSEVETFFHEFGHLMHGVLTDAPHASQSGTSVKRDFVEVPSQMFEHWVWDKAMLKLLSAHYENRSQTLPEELIGKMLAAKQYDVGYWVTRQLVLALYDLQLHIAGTGSNLAGQFNQLFKKYLDIKLPKFAIFAAGFGHLCGYDAGYYGYMWAKVYAVDLFTRFKKEGLLNADLGRALRDQVLAPGASQEEIDLVKTFLGRAPNNKAFLKEIGIG